jgi:hypothetical protein
VTKQITPAHVRRALAEQRRAGVTRSPPLSVLRQILAKLPAKELDLAFLRARRSSRLRT